jgi:hypothetical protein
MFRRRSVIRIIGVSDRAKTGVRINNPIVLTNANCIACWRTDLLRESGYVQNRFQMKLLVTAAMKEITLAIRLCNPRIELSRLNVPKSTMAPITPTTENFRNLDNSRRPRGEIEFTCVSENHRLFSRALLQG